MEMTEHGNIKNKTNGIERVDRDRKEITHAIQPLGDTMSLMIGDYECRFITTEASASRLSNLFQAIDDGSVDMYWTDRDYWFCLHSKFTLYPRPKPNREFILSRKMRKRLVTYRQCFGHPETHSFCDSHCGIREECRRLKHGVQGQRN